MAANGAKDEAPLQVKQGSKLSKLLSRESSVAAPSFRVYYGVASAGSVPFLWESQPGTPKNDAISDTVLPPLTPPPSYYTAGAKEAASHKEVSVGGRKGGKHSILSSILFLSKIRLRKARPSSSSPTSSFSSSTTSSSSSSSYSLSFRSTQSPSCASMRSHARAFSVGDEDDEEMAATACFRVRHESFRALKSCRVAMTLRSAMASSAGGHGPFAAAAQRV
ncbi:hypothetical protein GUJ93_ZPchr0008g11495 [Zizania palustris]|uniref:Uncharacterized protein n=1 Tax=Zizania palustris TaxID=103762 RepID=A0A8J5RAU8_ZIZPA|nr:hypothetical protein GUJ93_ZPchr0008g11495 [Zizania palustris]